MIEIKNVTIRFRLDESTVITALEDIDLTVQKGELLVILGPNGSGKSTLAKLMNGLIVPRTGAVTVEGINTSDISALQEVRRRVQMVFQDPDSQLVTTIVEDEIAFGLENLALDASLIQQRVEEALKAFGLEELSKAEPHFLSGGQKQKLSVAAAYAMRPNFLVLDEPTSMLDEKGCREVRAAIDVVRGQRQVGIVHITHDIQEILGADRVLVLSDGRVRMLGKPPEIINGAEELQKAGIDVPPQVKLHGLLQTELSDSDRIDPAAVARILHKRTGS